MLMCQRMMLRQYFAFDQHPSKATKLALVKYTLVDDVIDSQLTVGQLNQWFHGRRRDYKREQKRLMKQSLPLFVPSALYIQRSHDALYQGPVAWIQKICLEVQKGLWNPPPRVRLPLQRIDSRLIRERNAQFLKCSCMDLTFAHYLEAQFGYSVAKYSIYLERARHKQRQVVSRYTRILVGNWFPILINSLHHMLQRYPAVLPQVLAPFKAAWHKTQRGWHIPSPSVLTPFVSSFSSVPPAKS
jgi:hypothetical protein